MFIVRMGPESKVPKLYDVRRTEHPIGRVPYRHGTYLQHSNTYMVIVKQHSTYYACYFEYLRISNVPI